MHVALQATPPTMLRKTCSIMCHICCSSSMPPLRCRCTAVCNVLFLPGPQPPQPPKQRRCLTPPGAHSVNRAAVRRGRLGLSRYGHGRPVHAPGTRLRRQHALACGAPCPSPSSRRSSPSGRRSTDFASLHALLPHNSIRLSSAKRRGVALPRALPGQRPQPVAAVPWGVRLPHRPEAPRLGRGPHLPALGVAAAGAAPELHEQVGSGMGCAPRLCVNAEGSLGRVGGRGN